MFSKDNQVAFRTLFVMVFMMALVSCDSLKEKTGLTKKPPDEFTVITKAPLTMPPKFSLRPPRPGAKQLKVVQPNKRARNLFLDEKSKQQTTNKLEKLSEHEKKPSSNLSGKSGKANNAELELLRKAGANDVDSSIRQIVNKETSILTEKNSSIADRLIFWQEKQPDGSAVDAGKESKRLRESAAAGEPPNKTRTAVIKRRKKAIFEGLLNR